MVVPANRSGHELRFFPGSVSETSGEWRTIRGKFLAINVASMCCACPRSPKGLSPAAHLADGTADLILVRKCSRFDFLRHLLRHTSKDDQVGHVWMDFIGPDRSVPHSLLLLVSLTLPSSRSTACCGSASCRGTARATRTWSWTCWRMASGRFSARSAETTRPVAVPPPTAAGTVMARSWRMPPLMPGTYTKSDGCNYSIFDMCNVILVAHSRTK